MQYNIIYFTKWIPQHKVNETIVFCIFIGLWLVECVKGIGTKNLVHSVVLRGTQQIELFFNRIHWVPARPRRAASSRVALRWFALAITLVPVVGGGYQFSRQCDPPILPTAIKRLLSSNVYGYGAVITFPDLQYASQDGHGQG